MSRSPYTQEADYVQTMAQSVAPFWQQRQSGNHLTAQGTRLYWCSITSPTHHKALLILNGRVESVVKYQELFYEFFQQGYDIYSYDHRGQGLSERCCAHCDIGHIEHFNDYVNDLQQMVEFFALDKYQHRYMLAHSMGGAIALRYLQQYPQHPFDALAASAPMIGLPVPTHLRPIAIPYTYWLSKKSHQPSYAPGYGPYQAKPFVDNPLSHSPVRYQWFRQLYQENPHLQTGGPSSRWVWQSLSALRHLYRDAPKLKIPLLILQAGHDQIVDNRAQVRFARRLNKYQPQARLVTIAGAKHELLFEADTYRNQALEQIGHFFAHN